MTRSVVPLPLNHRGRGVSLVESLVALLVLALGILAASRAQPHLHLSAEASRHQSEALRLARDAHETLRELTRTGGTRVVSDSAIASSASSAPFARPGSAGARYGIDHVIADQDGIAAAATRIAVRWLDRAGTERQVAMASIVASTDPRHSAALTLPHPGAPAVSPFGRAPAVPLTARHLGNGTSVFKPLALGTIAWIVDNATGALTAECAVDARVREAELTAERLVTCRPRSGRIVSGYVRVSLSSATALTGGTDSLTGLRVALEPGDEPASASASCQSEGRKSISYREGERTVMAAVPLDAAPAFLGLSQWSDTGERYLAYHCILPAAAERSGAGAIVVTAPASTSPSGSPGHRVCRYAADPAEQGRLATSPAAGSQRSVDGIAPQQNFVVVPSTSSCPPGTTRS